MTARLAIFCLLGSTALAQCPLQCTCQAGGTIVDCSRKKLAAVPMRIPSSVVQLVLAHNLITSLPDDAFASLGNLTWLDLSTNRLSIISQYAFRGCCSMLSKLILTNNYIALIPGSLFDGLPRLRYLHLSENYFVAVPDLGANGSLSLEELYMENNRLGSATFPPSYAASTLLTRITLSNNRGIIRLRSGDFDHLAGCQVHRLYLSRCEISSIEPGSLTALTHLSSVSISENPLGAAGFVSLLEELRPAKALESLEVSQVQLNVPLTAAVLSSLSGSGIQEIDVSKNSIPTVEACAFCNTSSLKHIDLSANSLQALSAAAFDGLPALTTLRLAGNQLFQLPRFPPLVISLDVHGNRLQNLEPNAFASLSRLQWLNLKGNGLLRIDSTSFDGLFALRWLDISSNGMPNLSPRALASLAGLEFFNASYNKIKLQRSKEPLFASQRKLVTIDLSCNSLDCLSSSVFYGLRSLKHLNLSFNALGPCFSNMTCTGDVFSNLSTIGDIDMSGNGITVLPPRLFQNLTMLKALKLSHNGLMSWDDLDLFDGDSSLGSLALDENQISVLNRTSFAGLRGLSSVDLRNNPLACSCDMVWFRKWINQTDLKLNGLPLYQCHSPPDAVGTPFLKFDPDSLVCTAPPVLLISVLPSCIFAGILLLMALGYRYRWRIRFRIYAATRRSRGNGKSGYQQVPGCDLHYAAYISHCRNAKCKKAVIEGILPHIDNYVPASGGGPFAVHVDEKFAPNKSEISNVVEAVEYSALFVVFLCSHYRSNALCQLELDLALTLLLSSGGHRKPCVIVAYGDVYARHVPRVLVPAFEKGDYLQWVDDESSRLRIYEVLRDHLSSAGVSANLTDVPANVSDDELLSTAGLPSPFSEILSGGHETLYRC